MSARRRGPPGDKKLRKTSGRGSSVVLDTGPPPPPPPPALEDAAVSSPGPGEGVAKAQEEAEAEEEACLSLEEKEVDLKPYIQSRLGLSGVQDDMWTEEHKAAVDVFLKDPTKQLLVVYVDEFAGLKMEHAIPYQEQKLLAYFIRHENAEITAENFQQTVQFGTLRQPYIDSLLRLLNGVYLPRLFRHAAWPESIKNEFFSEVYHFMTSLTDTRSKMKGRTVLYIPIESLPMKPEAVVKDKALIQRLETSMIHWTRQIKEVLRAQEAVESRESTGPLEEIAFWKNRCGDLSEISKQLSKQGVKHIETILLLSKSSYVAAFQRLAKQIQDGSKQAQSNLRFLSILKEPFLELAMLKPKDIPEKLPHLISLVRIIWVNSPYYNSRERITALFRKMSNKIIKMCCQSISLDRIFEGYVESSWHSLRDCISCMASWKERYHQAAEMHNRLSGKGWVLDQSGIFAQVDAFVQRCKDLLEVCDCQQHFARWEDGKQTPLPCFFGHRGPQMMRNLVEIEETFQKHLLALRNMKGNILDVKNTFWHEDFNRFRAGMKDLEVMTQNLISSAFETVRDVEHGVEIQDIFHHLSERETIKRTFDKKAVDIYMLFNWELNLVNKELSKKLPFLPPYMGHYSGLAHWIRALRRRIDRPMICLAKAHFMPHIGRGEESFQYYQQLTQAMDEIERRAFHEWTQTLDKDSLKRLDTPLLALSAEKHGMLDVNFDKDLLKLFVEIHYWDRLLFEIPHYVAEVYERREDLRVLRENLLLVARDYNRIIDMLSPEERALFKERIRYLDRKIQPGLKKLHWSLKGASICFISECRLHASKVQAIVTEFKVATLAIARGAQQLSEALLVRLTGKRVYDDLEFEDDQRQHRAWAQQRLLDLYNEVAAILRQTYEVFKQDSPEVQQHWMAYMVKMDRMMEEAFRLNVKWSLVELSKAINGDGKTTPSPLFRVKVILQDNCPASSQVEFSPTLTQLANMVNDIGGHLIACISIFRHLPEVLTKRRFLRDPISVLVERDEDIKKIQALISGGMLANATHLQAYLKTWDVYREIWEVNKDSFINRYRHLNPLVSSFDADTARYMEVANNVQKEETVLSLGFVLLDCARLKGAVVQHCTEWQGKLTALLRETASGRLRHLHAHLRDSACSVSRPPQTLQELGQSLQLLENLQAELSQLEAQIPPIHDQFAILDKYEVPVEEEVLQLLGGLGGEWLAFQQCMLDSEVMLKRHKEKFKTGLIHSADDFKKKAQVLLQDFGAKGPFSSAVPCAAALEQIAALRQVLAAMQAEEGGLRSSLGLFKIEQPPSKDLQKLEKELDYLQQVWELTQAWELRWGEWKTGSFRTLQTETMESIARGLLRQLHKLSRDLKDHNWEVIETSKAKIEQFQRTMPLISDLRNPAMRDRHWAQVKDMVLCPFDQEADDFRLEDVVALGLDRHGEQVAEISAAATKELAIEQALQGIVQTWDVMQLDIVPYKDKGHHRLRGTDEVFQALEDNQVVLATMKASRFVRPFERDVDGWERCLSLVLEGIEMVLTVQRQWMYLENIFLGEDIRKQLPEESASFDQINASWKGIMDRLSRDANALRGTHYPGLLDTLAAMAGALEDIQKSLDMFLETKRRIFPRFYFLSNDDLLEVLGQARSPDAVQPHLKKCFDSLRALRVQKVGMGNRSEAMGMCSLDGEYVEFSHPVLLEGPVEEWLCDVERTMRWTLRDLLRNCRLALKKMLTKRDKWVKEWAGQLVIAASQMQWTADVTKCLLTCKERGDRKFLKVMKKKQVSLLHRYSEALRGSLPKLLRLKVVALVTVEVHARDVIDRLHRCPVPEPSAFDWLSQLRLYWDKDTDDCVIRQTNAHFPYGYEYLGTAPRLVITPLTDRCYITLTTALHLHRGGSPKGPAGTGKTETVKDLGKALGMYVIVVNCSEGLDYKSMGRMYSGLAQTGAWGCFDEFNRINVEVLSVVAQQILSILSALAASLATFAFEGHRIHLVPSCGIFITMNPGYAGRTELPDNLKSMFRPIAMVVPDSTLIAEIILFAEGFSNCKVLAKKVYTLYSLAQQQLSRQDHYDFGLRALTSLLRYAGRKRRTHADLTDEEILLLAMKDMNVAKLTSGDLPLFTGIIQDLFPGIESPTIDYGKLKETIEGELKQVGLQVTPLTITKVIQLHETKNSRHSTVIVGSTGSGKTVTWRTLQAALSALHRCGDPTYSLVREFPLNPKALSLGELYGEYDLSTSEWTDGILSSVMRSACADERPDEKWVVFDGPVDTLWIESMNSVMDDNKVLTLTNGERIALPEQVSLLFEVENLAVASPATVSRCGVVYMDYSDLGWRPYVHSWIERRPKSEAETLQRMFDKFLDKMLAFKRDNCCELVPVPEYSGVVALCRLFSALATPENGVNPADVESYGAVLEMYFLFSMIWSVCAAVDEEGRKRIDAYIREMEGSFPNKDTVYEYFVDAKRKNWASFEDKLPKMWRYPPTAPFHKILVPTMDTVRYNHLVTALLSAQSPVLLVGPVGTGKTSIAQGVLQGLDRTAWAVLTVNMSAQTSSSNVQSAVESRVEKRTKGVYVPLGGKSLATFLDDLNMPARDAFGAQPPLELLRQWLDYGFWYDRAKQSPKYIKDMFLLAAMGPPGGGRTEISPRLQSRFNLINMTFPSDSQIRRIFGTLLNQKLQAFEESVKPLGPVVTEATVELYHSVAQRFLPTPACIHYLFSLRDIAKVHFGVFQGLLRSHKDFHDTKTSLTRLWVHECFRVFADRLVDAGDAEAFTCIVGEKLGTFFDLTFHGLCPSKRPPLFGDFLGARRVYEELADLGALRAEMEQVLAEHNQAPGAVPLRLVLFRDAIEHIMRIVRVIGQPRGNLLLVGIGGSGRQSLARLASALCQYCTFQIQPARHYRRQDFRDDLKRLYRQAGMELVPTTFLFTDSQASDEAFLEDINSLLSAGEVPALYRPDEWEEIQALLLDAAKAEGVPETPDSLFAFLIERVRDNLHVVLCLSPVGELFRNWIRQYPALVSCTTIDWFSEWPRQALLEVAEKYLEGVDLGPQPEMARKVARIFTAVHGSVATYSQKMLVEMRRYNYVTPSSYLELVSGYKKLLGEKRQELGQQAGRLRTGLARIDETRTKVEAMGAELAHAKCRVAEVQRQCEEYLVVIVQQKREADEQQKTVTANSEKIAAEEVKCKALADNAQKDLEEALPALEEAMKALESLNKKDMTEIKSYGRPPGLVETVMQAVMILRGSEPSWAEAKRQLSEPTFIKQLIHFDKDNISDKVLKKIGGFCAQPDFQPDIVGRVSLAAKSLCMWVRAMEMYGRIYRVVEPKRARMNAAAAQLAEKQASQAEAQAKLREVAERLERLKQEYEEKLAQKEELRARSEDMELKLDRADKLVSGLAGEKARWEETVQGLDEDLGYVVGDCLLAAAFLSYMGPFLSNYRDEIVSQIWMKQIREEQVPCSPRFSLPGFLATPPTVRTWTLQGLPSDAFSTENGLIVTRGTRWPLMIDPQGQASKWIKNMEADKGLRILDLQGDYLGALAGAVQQGVPVLIHDLQEQLDPALTPLLGRAVTRVGGRLLLRLGDREVEYSPAFRLYLTTKLSNPHYAPETAARAAIVNFAVKEQGLEAQLLGIVVRKERPELEEQKDTLVLNIAAGKRRLQELEDEILRLLNEATGSLLDDLQLVTTLQSSKVTAGEVSDQLATSEATEAKIDAAREAYRPCAQRAAVLFFVLMDMGRIDPMYQFSLDAYVELFTLSIARSPRGARLDERIRCLNDHHTYAVYRYACRGLFECHKLLFSFHMCAKILEVAGSLHTDEYSFFLRGGVVLDHEGQMDNPCPSWLPDAYWDNVTELDKLPSFHGIMNSFEQHPRDWHLWYSSARPERALLPGEWENACGQLQRMLVVRALRPDRVGLCISAFVVSHLGSAFVEPPVLSMKAVLEDSLPRTPLVFVLSPGVDPAPGLLQLAEQVGMALRLHALSLGQGQAPIATRMIQEGVRHGSWVFLANCHLSLSWMPQLAKLVEQLAAEDPHPDFRLWLSSSPHPGFPISVLQAAIKVTTEPPTGLKANMTRLYQLVTEPQFGRCSRLARYKKLLFALCFFHSLLLERRQFLQLGWNVIYGFNDSDFEVSENLLSLYLDEYEETPWEALRYLIAGVNYGGHVTDNWDRRLLLAYSSDCFCEQALATPFYKLSALDTYYIPKDGDLASYREHISMLPAHDPPGAFGQHTNAAAAAAISTARTLLDTLLALQPQRPPSPAAQSREDKVLELAGDVLARVPTELDLVGARQVLADDPSPLTVVLLQEMQRYNALLRVVRSSLVELEKGIQGLVVMSTTLEEIFNCIHDARVPPLWERAYPSLKPLGSWTRDLGQRVEQLARWAETAHPPVLFWLGGFTFPTGFLTAVLQGAARQSKEGVWVRGLFLEGAGWDRRNSCLAEAAPMQLVCALPSVHFRPVESRKKAGRGFYSCPLYVCPRRAAGFVLTLDLRAGAAAPETWAKRGAAALLSLDV
ncbi:dynein axonemal heavy chain 2 isoform X3 [Alligator mississippiensis]|uniref:dynein axonemal heavy chain 2 isoform X3 n=1 Tax=Alligator mississippiensis TaxID=8496 RepID=UPI0028776127|nr:dynein axonemal heavy chain 2 isoform X3 [Alligator mississippiensis]